MRTKLTVWFGSGSAHKVILQTGSGSSSQKIAPEPVMIHNTYWSLLTGSTSDRGNVYGGIMVDIEAKGSKFP